MASKNALLSLSSGVNEKYIFQAIKVTKVSDKTTRLTLSDGNAYISADIPTARLREPVAQYSLLKLDLKYNGLGYPAEIRSLEIVEGKYSFLMGKPVPFLDYINEGFRSDKSEHESEDEKGRNLVEEQPRYFRNMPKTIPQIINLEDNDKEHSQGFNEIRQDPHITIDQLEPKMTNWKILARVSWIDSKMIQVKAGLKAGQKVLVLNFFITDRYAKEIKCSCFDEAALKFQQILKKDSIYDFSNGKIIEEPQQHASRRFINIRFQLFSTITEVQDPPHHIPWHSYNLTAMNKLEAAGEDQEYDVAGIVKTILKKEDTNSTKLRMSMVFADPTLYKEIDVLLYLEPEEALRIVQFAPLILKNIKIMAAEEGTITLKSCFNTHYLTSFEADEAGIKPYEVFRGKDIEKEPYESQSKINYHLRSLGEHLQSLELCFGDQKIFSKINCYFLGPFGEKKYYYQACVKCLKKVSTVNKKPNYCEKCRKIVEIREQYLLKSEFADWSKHIKVTLVGDYAKTLLKYEPAEFVKMSQEGQSDCLNALKFSEVCLYLKSWRTKEAFNHNVQIIEKPHQLGLSKIQRILSGVKEES